MCGLQSNLTNGFLNKYGSLICNQKDMRMAEATTAMAEAEAEVEEGAKEMYANGSGWTWPSLSTKSRLRRGRTGGVGAELAACNLVAQSANRCHYKRKPQAKQANAEGKGEAKANTACEQGLASCG